MSAGRPGYGTETDARSKRQYAAIRSMAAGTGAGWAGPVGQAFVDQLELARTLAPVVPAEDRLPDQEIVAKLEVAARLINANLGFRVVTDCSEDAINIADLSSDEGAESASATTTCP